MQLNSEFTHKVIDQDGYVSPKALADQFHTTVKDVSYLTGISINILGKKARAHSKISQNRLRETVEIINRVTPWCGNVFQAYAWYRSEPLPGFGDLTAEDLVKDGKAEAIKRYIARIAEGGYA